MIAQGIHQYNLQQAIGFAHGFKEAAHLPSRFPDGPGTQISPPSGVASGCLAKN